MLKGDLMNSFDLMIERYKKELVDAKSKSIPQAIDELNFVADKDISAGTQQVMADVMPIDEAEKQTDTSNMIVNNEAEVNAEPEENEARQVEEAKPIEELAVEPSMENIHSTRPGDSTLEQDLINQAIKQSIMNPPGGVHQLESFGSLKVQVFAADQVYPIAAACVTVNGGGTDTQYFKGYTDTSGIVDDIVLPSPNPNASQLPSKVIPYAEYDVFVEHPRFIKSNFLNVPIFPNIKSIQAVQLVPNSATNHEETTVTENEPYEPSLTEVENA